MLDFIFEGRDKLVNNLLKLGDYLGRSLRENVQIFSIDSQNNKVSFISESDKVITGTYDFDENNKILINDVKVEDADVFKDNNKFNDFVGTKITSFINDIREDNYSKAENNFTSILNLWEDRLKFSKIKDRLEEKSSQFGVTNRIIETEEFKRLMELEDNLVKFLVSQRNKISNISEIRNAVKLSNTVSNAFDMPKLSYDDLEKLDVFTINEETRKSVYEMVCRQELVKKELLESKQNFDTVWATNDKVQNLAGMIFDDENKVALALAEAILDVPFLALATKKQLAESVEQALGLNESVSITPKEVKHYASTLFNLKKPVKNTLIEMLSEEYGINVQNLKEPPSFKSLVNTQIVIFETLAKVSPKGSAQKEVLSEVASMLKNKSGVESLDVNEYLQKVFEVAGYDTFLNESTLLRYMDFDRMGTDLGDVADVLKMIKRAAAKGEMAAREKTAGLEGGGMPADTQYAPDGGEENDDLDTMQQAPDDVPNLTPEDEEEGNVPVDSQDPTGQGPVVPSEPGMGPDDMENTDGQDMPGDAQLAGGPEMEQPEMGGMPTDMPTDVSKDELVSLTKELDDLLQTLKLELGGDEGSGPEDMEMGGEEMPPEEMGDGELDAEQDELTQDHENMHDEEEEVEDREQDLEDEEDEREESNFDPKKKKDKESK